VRACFCPFGSGTRYCYHLTITDVASRFLLACEVLATTQARFAFPIFERAFKDFGLAGAIRTDNGGPFASAHALYGLSKLSVWWLRLGIRKEQATQRRQLQMWPQVAIFVRWRPASAS
jgi:transposase InsO family protein